MTRAGVMGWPVEHSRSPVLHGFWLKHYGIAGTYVKLPVPPEGLRAALRALPGEGFAGCNLTLPHKEAALAIVDHVDASARRIGAVIWHLVDRPRLTMRAFSNRFLDAYLATLGDEALASVGVYQLEGLGVQLFERIEGDYFSILGLPLLPLLDFLRGHGVVLP